MIVGILMVALGCCLGFSFFLMSYYLEFFVLYSFIMILINILETYVSFLYSQIISSKISGYSGIIIIFCTTGGKIIGSLLTSGFTLIKEYYDSFEWRFYSAILALVLGITIKNYYNLKVNAISRIIKKKEYFN